VPVKVLLVDDSAVVRGLMNKALSADPAFSVIGSASNGQMAINMTAELHPDVIILDLEMPVMDGITALPELLKVSPGCKVVIASTLSLRNAEISLKALSLGASDYLAKPSAKVGGAVEEFHRQLIEKIKALGPPANRHVPAASAAVAVQAPVALSAAPPKVIKLVDGSEPLHRVGVQALAIASSTGGPQALLRVFEDLKGRLKNIPIFITQHMPPTFTTILAEHISKASGRVCSEAAEGMQVAPGCIYVAPGDYHMIAEKNNTGQVVLHITQDAPENFCRPAADPMLRALSKIYGRHLAVLVLTGMGQDGMEGAKIAAKEGAGIIAQNEQTSVVYGMPKAVAEAGVCRAILPLEAISKYLIEQIEGR